MSNEWTIAVISGVTALVTVGLTVFSQARIAKRKNDLDEKNALKNEERMIARYREPLAIAAADLQSRIFMIVKRDFGARYYVDGSRREQTYALNNTVFLFAQCFAWMEAIRVELQFIKLTDSAETKTLFGCLSVIYSLIGSGASETGLRVFPGEQRAVGERMLRKVENGVRCVGYGEFLDRRAFEEDAIFRALIDDVTILLGAPAHADAKLVELQNALVDLMDHLDSEHIRFPTAERGKITADIGAIAAASSAAPALP